MPAVKTILSAKKGKKQATGGAPACPTCGRMMSPSYDSEGNPIWICKLDQTTLPREE